MNIELASEELEYLRVHLWEERNLISIPIQENAGIPLFGQVISKENQIKRQERTLNVLNSLLKKIS